MNTYHIIDSLGFCHATIKSSSDFEAVDIYKKGMPKNIEYIIMAVPTEKISCLINNLKIIK